MYVRVCVVPTYKYVSNTEDKTIIDMCFVESH